MHFTNMFLSVINDFQGQGLRKTENNVFRKRKYMELNITNYYFPRKLAFQFLALLLRITKLPSSSLGPPDIVFSALVPSHFWKMLRYLRKYTITASCHILPGSSFSHLCHSPLRNTCSWKRAVEVKQSHLFFLSRRLINSKASIRMCVRGTETCTRDVSSGFLKLIQQMT